MASYSATLSSLELDPVVERSKRKTAQPFVLTISPVAGDWTDARRVLSRTDYPLAFARDVDRARKILSELPVAVILIEADELGSSWREVLAELDAPGRAPNVVVMTRCASERLWVEVLDSGGFDLVAKPVTDRELWSAVDGAMAAWLHRHQFEHV